jgi:hypothetical protein
LGLTREKERREMMNLNEEKMATVIREAFDKVTGSRRWQTAIAKAKQQIEENPYMSYDGHALLVLSPSGEIYTANGTCQCRAFEQGVPCWHRAAARLVERYFEAR